MLSLHQPGFGYGMPILSFLRFAGRRNTAPYSSPNKSRQRGCDGEPRPQTRHFTNRETGSGRGDLRRSIFRDCSATKFTEWGGLAGPVTLYGIEVAREDIEAAKVCEPLSTRQPVLKPNPLCRQRRLQLNQSL
jgi:hypothetical protein